MLRLPAFNLYDTKKYKKVTQKENFVKNYFKGGMCRPFAFIFYC